MNAIFNRRSIRKFTSEAVTDEQVRDLLHAAMAAPSGGNEKPWHFVVIRDRATLNAVTKINPYAGMLKEAPLAILACGDLSLEKFKGFWIQDVAASIENMLIEATDLGLGSVWTGVYPREERVVAMKELLNLPEAIIPLGLVALGYPAQKLNTPDRYDETKVHYETW